MSETLTPVFRLEYFIVAAENGTPCDLEPIFNEEKYLHAIAGASVDLPMPVGRTQEYLAKLAGMDVEIPDHPIFRTEYYLAHMIDSTVECPAPIFREEMFYYEWASNEYVTVTGNPVSFTAKAAPLRKLEVAFSPVQDLHGYDSPWPAGGGKNLRGDLPLAQDFAARFTSGTLDTTNKTFTFPYNTTEANEPLPAVPTFEENTQYTFILTMKNDGIARTNLQILYTDGTSSYFADLSGAGVKQTVALASTAGKTVKTLARRQQGGATIVYYEESGVFKGVLTASQFAPYSNICPISGWDSLTVEQAGKNLWGKQLGNNTYVEFDTIVGAQYTVSAKMIDPEAGTYLQLAKAPVGTSTWSSIGYVISNKTVTPRTFTAEDGYKYALWANASYTNVEEVQIELGSPASSYTPYNPSSRSISITLGQTVYGGTVDVVTGVGEIDYVKDVYDGSSDEVWGYTINETPSAFYTQITLPANNPQSMGNYLKRVTAFGAVIGFSYIIHSAQIRVSDMGGECADTTQAGAIAKLRAYLAANPFEVVHKITTPIPIQLTPQEVESLAGDNTLFSDANGDLTVEYRSN